MKAIIVGALLFSALALNACSPSRKLTGPLVLPLPPASALVPCEIPALTGGDAAAVDAALIERGAAIAACEARRVALVRAWPK